MTDKYAVLGNPIGHSKSPFIHTEFAKLCQQDMEYTSLLCPLDDFKGTVDNFFTQNGKGLNITVPFKEQAYQYATQLTLRAKDAGAVNTLKYEDGKIIGDNTDGAGFMWDITNRGWSLTDKTVLLVGAGGAARGILGPIMQAKPRLVVIVNRTVSKAQAVAKLFPGVQYFAYDDERLAQMNFEVVINCTSLSLQGKLPPLHNSIITSATKAYDLMYATQPTVFLQWAQKLGAQDVADGLGMLVGQAAESFSLWRGVEPNASAVLATLRSML